MARKPGRGQIHKTNETVSFMDEMSLGELRVQHPELHKQLNAMKLYLIGKEMVKCGAEQDGYLCMSMSVTTDFVDDDYLLERYGQLQEMMRYAS